MELQLRSSISHTEVKWYVVHTRNQLRTKQLFEFEEGIVETFLPMIHRDTTQEDKLKATPLVSTYLFVRGSKAAILKVLKSADGLELEMSSLRSSKHPMIVPDEEMELFRSFSEMHLNVERLRNPYRTFFNNDRARILTGPFAGYEGFIKEIKRDLKLIIRFGDWAMAVANIQKYDLEIISNAGSRESEQARLARLQDYFTARLHVFGAGAKTTEVLRHLVADFHQHKTIAKIQDEIRNRYPDRSQMPEAERLELAFLHELEANPTPIKTTVSGSKLRSVSGETDEIRLEQMALYIYSKEPHPDLCRIFPDSPLRPFLTPVGQESEAQEGVEMLNFPVTMPEGSYDVATDRTRMQENRYQAHVGVTRQADGTVLLFTNWDYLYRQFLLMNRSARENLQEKLEKYQLTHFHKALFCPEAKFHFLQHPTFGCYGLATCFPSASAAEVKEAARQLVEQGQAIVQEIMTSTRMRFWQKCLCKVWIRM